MAESFTKEFSLAMVDTEHEENGETWSKEEKDVLAELYICSYPTSTHLADQSAELRTVGLIQ